MRDRGLHEALRDFALDAAALLSRELEAGGEVPFELVAERPGRGARGPVLYRYRSLTAAFIEPRWSSIRELQTYPRAAGALRSGARPYLRHRGLSGWHADDALRDLVERVFDDATDFRFPEERFERIFAELEGTLEDGTVTATVAAPVHGVRIASARLHLEEGLALARRSAVEPPPAALEGTARLPHGTSGDDEDEPDASPLDVFCVLERRLSSDAPLPIDEARARFRRVLAGLRLCGAGGGALGPLAWARAGHGAWRPVALGLAGRVRPESWELRSTEEAELRDLLGILARSRHGTTVAWALDRFEKGCERELETEALSDYLLALRALLAEPGSAGEESVALRLAALCAPDGERRVVQEAVELAFRLERHLAYGGPAPGPGLALDSPRAVVRQVERHLRALLRDVLCGYLDQDLRRAADDMLLAAPGGGARLAGAVRDREAASRAAGEEDTRELEALAVAPSAGEIDDRSPEGGMGEPVPAAVTPSLDWGAGEDP